MKKLYKSFVLVLLTIFPSFSLNNAMMAAKEINSSKQVAHSKFGDEIVNEKFNYFSSNQQEPIFIENNYASYYFYNLTENFGNNIFGTCSYVSIGMLLSFYDTYWDDAIIPEEYDAVANFNQSRQLGADFDLLPSNISSPGIRFESQDMLEDVISIEDYDYFIEQNSNSYFQLKLLSLGKDCFGDLYFDTEDELGMFATDFGQLLDYYLVDYLDYENSDFSITTIARNETNMKTKAVQNIENGMPVIINIELSNGEVHSVIGYDYDETNDEIYVHTGWRDEQNGIALTHVSLEQLGYEKITSVIAFEMNTYHVHCDNYLCSNGEEYCSCFYAIPNEITIVGGYYFDVHPTFKWISLFDEKWFEYSNLSISLSILDSEKHPYIELSYPLYSNTFTLSDSEWTQIKQNLHDGFYAYLTLNSTDGTYWDDYWCRQFFEIPNTYSNVPYISPDQYEFEEDVYPSELNKEDDSIWTEFTEHIATNGFEFETRRYRAGYIQDEYIVLSPIHEDINKAFIEYRFKSPVSRIDVSLSYWRDPNSEWITNSQTIALLQRLEGNNYVTELDLLAESTNLPVDRNSQRIYTINFEVATYRIRFYMETEFVSSSDDNRGRICIGNMAFYPIDENFMGLSGSELDFRNSSVELSSYAYAIDNYIGQLGYDDYANQQPGDFAKFKGESINTSGTTSAMIDNFLLDYHVLNISLGQNLDASPINRYGIPSDNSYKIAIVTVGTTTYWFRQDSDGLWSYKPNNTSHAINVDFDGNLIVDPYDCNLGNYSKTVSYFEVSSWSAKSV